VLVILDSNHERDHVLDELRLYGPLVSSGSYLIVEDSNVNGHPVVPAFGPGPSEAIADFLAETDEFSVDATREKFFLTFNPGGYLRKRSDDAQT
jgi:cephalosporin hydroxylase